MIAEDWFSFVTAELDDEVVADGFVFVVLEELQPVEGFAGELEELQPVEGFVVLGLDGAVAAGLELEDQPPLPDDGLELEDHPDEEELRPELDELLDLPDEEEDEPFPSNDEVAINATIR